MCEVVGAFYTFVLFICLMEFIAYTPEELLQKLISVVLEDHRHEDYDRVKEVAKWSNQIMTGDDQREILIRYKTSEDPAQQEQRIRVTNSRTQYVGNKAFNLFSEPHRADRTVSTIGTTSDAGDEVIAGLVENLQSFSAGRDLETWLDERFKYLNFYDPNAFIVTEFDNTEPEKRKPIAYPFEVSSESAVDFEYQRGALQYLIVVDYEKKKNSEGEDVEVAYFTMYAPMVSMTMVKVPPKMAGIVIMPDDAILLNVQLEDFDATEKVYYQVFDNGSETTPAVRIGAYQDPTTKLRTFVSPLYPAEKLFTDLIWTKSEYDLSKALHGFYQKFMYVDECPICEGSGSTRYNDAVDGVQQVCGRCQGTGVNSHLTVQDIIEVRRPDTREEHIPLSEFIHLVQIPMELIRLQKEDVRDIEQAIFNAVFGANVLERAEVTVTATEKRYDWRAVNNKMAPYADKYVEVYKSIVYQVAVHRQERENLIVEYAFPSDFNLESLNDQIAQRGAAIAAGAPAAVIHNFDLNILHKQNKDNPAIVATYRAKEQHRPFQGKQLQEIVFFVQTLPEFDYQRILYLHFDPILDSLIAESPSFVVMGFVAQQALIKAEVKKINAASRLLLFDPSVGGATET